MSRHWMMYRSQFERGALLTANSAPTDIALSASSIAENAGLGSLLATISGTDPNTGDTLTYSLTNDAGGRFGVSGSNLIVTGVLDYETRPTETITIRATDSGGLTYDKTFTITITDVAETTPANPLPGGTTTDDGSFAQPVAATTVSGSVKLSGKKSSGSSGKFVYSIAAAPTAGYKYTCQYDPDFSLLAQGGKLAAVGFGLKNGNNFHLMTLMGNGSTGLNVAKVSGSNFSATTGQTITTVGAAHNGTQAGPNWIQLEISSDGLTYTLRTSADGTTWTDEITGATPSPLTGATSATSFGIAAYFDGTDSGSFVIDVKLWQAANADTRALSTTDRNSSITLSNNNLTATATTTTVHQGVCGNVWLPVENSVRYFEVTVGATGGEMGIGVCAIGQTLNNYAIDDNGMAYVQDGRVVRNNATIGAIASFAAGDVIGVRVTRSTTAASNTIAFRKNGGTFSLEYAMGTILPTVPIAPFLKMYNGGAATFNFNPTMPSGSIGWPTPVTSAGAHRYWRLIGGVYGGDAANCSIAELQLRLTSGGANQVSGGTPTASSFAAAGFEADKAFDGSTTTSWASSAAGSQWLEYAFASGVTKALAEVAITSRSENTTAAARSPLRFAMEYSDDNTTWTRAVAHWNGTAWGITETRTFSVPQ